MTDEPTTVDDDSNEIDADDSHTAVAASGDSDTDPNDGLSPLATPAAKQWDAGDRPVAWQGHIYGLVVHTTGSGLPASADALGVYHTVRAIDHYSRSHGCHYVNGWGGAEAGELLQLANEREQAHGVGVTNAKDPSKDQRRSIEASRFEDDLPAVLVRLWRARWPGYENSLALLPGTKSANSCYAHLECVPCVYHSDHGLVTAQGVEPMRPGLRFTQAQHDTVAALAVDVAKRNRWPGDQQWWHTPRLVGHEDLTPISRHDQRGGWDPGYLREAPYFDWDYVYAQIGQALFSGPDASNATGTDRSSILDTVTDLGDRLSALVATGQEHLAVALAHQRGINDLNEVTNLLFFARHPEMNGRKIASHETDLAQEWIDIRDTIVKPALERLNEHLAGAP
jgi:N-acetylmuramoyl-L-alanine amidase